MENGKSEKEKFLHITKHGRLLSQALFFLLTLFLTIRFLGGDRNANLERYCPFGGVETLIPWLNKTGTICSLSTMNISILIGVIVVTLLFKRVFCSHICPLGSVLEWVGIVSRKFGIKNRRIPEKIDRALTWLKYPLLILIIWLTVATQELVFRDFDPYYVLFTAGKGHGIAAFGIWITLAVLILGAAIPMAFCKYLCPMGACLAPFSRVGATRIFRDDQLCTSCGACDKACEWGVKVSTAKAVKSAECTNCLECVRGCPEKDVLAMRIGR